MVWDTTTIALVVSSLVTFFGILPQVIQAIAYSRSDKTRVGTETINARSQELVQFASASQTLQSANVTLINELQEETQILRARNTELRNTIEISEKSRLAEHLSGQRLLSDLSNLREQHISSFHTKEQCPFGKILERKLKVLIDKYEPVFANGMQMTDEEGKENEEAQKGDTQGIG